jgi:hypothetical protein
MKAIWQTRFEDKSGDCLSAAIASILEWDLDEIPNFSFYGNQFYPKLWEWLKERNIGIMAIDNIPTGFHLIKVRSPRVSGAYHELVGLNGERIHDPHPKGNCEGELFCYEILYPINPAMSFIRTGERYKYD